LIELQKKGLRCILMEAPPPGALCSICVCPAENPHALVCGCAYCPACIVEWFRRGNTSCPNCRAGTEVRMIRPDTLVRASYLMRYARSSGASSKLKRFAERVRITHAKYKLAQKEAMALKREHKEVLKKERDASRRKWRAMRKWMSVRRELGVANFECQPLPVMRVRIHRVP